MWYTYCFICHSEENIRTHYHIKTHKEQSLWIGIIQENYISNMQCTKKELWLFKFHLKMTYNYLVPQNLLVIYFALIFFFFFFSLDLQISPELTKFWVSSLFYLIFTRGQAGARRETEIHIIQVCTSSILGKKISGRKYESTTLSSSALRMIHSTTVHSAMIINNMNQCPFPFSTKTGLKGILVKNTQE